METIDPGVAIWFLISLFIQAGFLLWGARIVQIEDRSFAKSIGVVIIGAAAFFLLSPLIADIPTIGPFFELLGGVLVTAIVMMPICNTTFGQALGATIIAGVLGFVIIGGITILGSAMLNLMATPG